jgi:hypothetical protein
LLPPGYDIELEGRGAIHLRELGGPPGAPAIALLHGWTATADVNWYKCYTALGNLLGGAQPTRVVQLSPSFGRCEELARLGGGVRGADRHLQTGNGGVACGARGVADGSALTPEPPGRGGNREGEREDGPQRSSQIVSTSRTRTRNSPFGAS